MDTVQVMAPTEPGVAAAPRSQVPSEESRVNVIKQPSPDEIKCHTWILEDDSYDFDLDKLCGLCHGSIQQNGEPIIAETPRLLSGTALILNQPAREQVSTGQVFEALQEVVTYHFGHQLANGLVFLPVYVLLGLALLYSPLVWGFVAYATVMVFLRLFREQPMGFPVTDSNAVHPSPSDSATTLKQPTDPNWTTTFNVYRKQPNLRGAIEPGCDYVQRSWRMSDDFVEPDSSFANYSTSTDAASTDSEPYIRHDMERVYTEDTLAGSSNLQEDENIEESNHPQFDETMPNVDQGELQLVDTMNANSMNSNTEPGIKHMQRQPSQDQVVTNGKQQIQGAPPTTFARQASEMILPQPSSSKITRFYSFTRHIRSRPMPRTFTQAQEEAIQVICSRYFDQSQDLWARAKYLCVNGNGRWGAIRALDARQWRIPEACELIEGALEWRQHERIDDVFEQELTSEELTILRHGLKDGFYGLNKIGDPLWWCPAGSVNLNNLRSKIPLEKLLLLHIQEMEFNQRVWFKELSKRQDRTIYRIAAVIDLKHFSVSSVRGAFWEAFDLLGNVDQRYYYENISQIYVINAPIYFRLFWKTISPLLQPASRDKVRVLSSPHQLREYIDEDIIPQEYGGTFSGPPAVTFHSESVASTVYSETFDLFVDQWRQRRRARRSALQA